MPDLPPSPSCSDCGHSLDAHGPDGCTVTTTDARTLESQKTRWIDGLCVCTREGRQTALDIERMILGE